MAHVGKRKRGGYVTVGLDVSCDSPGLCILWDTGEVDLVGVQQKKTKEVLGMQTSGKFRVHMMPYDKKTSVTQRGMQYSQILRKCLAPLVPRKDEVRLVIEGYSFNSKSSSITQLAEMQGHVKHVLADMGFAEPVQAPPSMAKEAFTGKGDANKVGMYAKFLELGGPRLLKMLGRKRMDTDANKPTEDLVDAYALAACYDKILSMKEVAQADRLRKKRRKRAQKEEFPPIE